MMGIKKHHFKWLTLVIVFSAISSIALAQTPPPGNNTDPEAAFDIFSGILLLIGVAYGGFRMTSRDKS